jgi:photosystem II stability/assembly factor-like uncharacterized protein
MNVWFQGQTMNSWAGLLLVTSDGGQTWKWASDAPSLMRNPEMLLRSPSEGWLFGWNGGITSLYVTRDGAHTWQEVAPQVPNSDQSTVGGLPTFEDAKHGFLQVNGVRGELPAMRYTKALMATSDGGLTWRLDRTVANLDEIGESQYTSSKVVGSDWIFAASSQGHPLLTRVGPGARIDASTQAATPREYYKQIDGLSFADPKDGWVIDSGGQLMSTTDEGTTWSTLTPGPKPIVIP